jgi:hypothetical protein
MLGRKSIVKIYPKVETEAALQERDEFTESRQQAYSAGQGNQKYEDISCKKRDTKMECSLMNYRNVPEIIKTANQTGHLLNTGQKRCV